MAQRCVRYRGIPGPAPQRVIKGLLDVKRYDSTGMVTMIDTVQRQMGLAEDLSTDSDEYLFRFFDTTLERQNANAVQVLYTRPKDGKVSESDDANRMALLKQSVREKCGLSASKGLRFAVVYKPLCKIIAIDDFNVVRRIQWARHNCQFEFGIFVDDTNDTAQGVQLMQVVHTFWPKNMPQRQVFFNNPFVISVGKEDTIQSVRAKIVSVLKKKTEVIKMGLDYDADIRISLIENVVTPGPSREICSNHHTRYYFRSHPQDKSGGAVGEDLNHGADVLRSHDIDGNGLKMRKVFEHVKINNQIPATEGEPIKNVNEFMFGVEYLRKNGSYYNNDFGGYNTRGKGATGGGYATF